MLVELRYAGHMQADHPSVLKVILGRETIRRVDEQSRNKGRGRKDSQRRPVRNAMRESGNGNQQNKRIHRQEIARQQRSTQNAEKQRVREQNEEDAPESSIADPRLLIAFPVEPRV